MDYATFLQSVRRAMAVDHPDSPRSDEAVLNDLCEAYRRQATALLQALRSGPLGPNNVATDCGVFFVRRE